MTDVRVFSGTLGLSVASGATVALDRAVFESLLLGLQVEGNVEMTSSLIAGTSTGVAVSDSGSLVVDYATIAGNGNAGVINAGSGAVTIAHSIVWNNATDLIGIDCADVQSSDVGTPDCSAVNGNVNVDPALEPDYRLAAGSPVLEFVAPQTFDGTPCRDLDGGPRLRDFDGDGLAAADLGAYEAADPAPEPEVANLRWLDTDTLEWDLAGGATLYHVYRGDVASLADRRRCGRPHHPRSRR